ncbi:epidermis-specific secreted glycoprotein EP1-like [Vigna unguiculata]|uniref:epidermis-specific secreted glycoprotein EP1-like n=1 Tax=Vigna unguiculata TaxID=3917 RepID=UPI001016AE07|nr:epidermis-specific secreted glycoprotein EP1-like [Vigna unguiculata]
MASVPQSKTSPLIIFFFFFFLFSSFTIHAIVPQNETFKFENSGEFGPYITEYDASYRMQSLFSSPFQLAFYNTTPNAFTLALRMGLRRSEQLFRWVWEANRGNPVGENATFSLGTDGNLVLAEADGRVAWQTNTANKGVVALRLLPNGNMVLLDAQGKFVWQSFDHPTDTLLIDQYLRAKGPSKLVSRLSARDNVNGPYSLVLEPKRLALYYKSKNSPRPVLYWYRLFTREGSVENITLTSYPDTFEIEFTYSLSSSTTSDYRTMQEPLNNIPVGVMGMPVNNSTLTYLRLGIDGNIRLHTYFLRVRSGVWEVTYTLFDRDSHDESECQWPEKCGNLGLCQNEQCVGCPLENGVFGWSNNCSAKPVKSCKASDFHYYKLEGVRHYMSKYSEGEKVSESTCGNKCTKDCKCVGYFYHRENSRCWIAYDLETLTRVANSKQVGFIKVPN